jgi:cell division protein FtsL
MSFVWSATIIQFIFILGIISLVYFLITMNNKIKRLNNKIADIERKLNNNNLKDYK